MDLETSACDPIDNLRREHDELRRQIDLLLSSIGEAATAVPSDARIRAISDLATSLAAGLPFHIRREEEALFAVFEKSFSGPCCTVALRAEHREILCVLSDLLLSIDEMRKRPRSEEGLSGLEAAANALISLFERHALREEQVFYTLARCNLSERQIEEINCRLKCFH